MISNLIYYKRREGKRKRREGSSYRIKLHVPTYLYNLKDSVLLSIKTLLLDS